jgi:hypothetical protein
MAPPVEKFPAELLPPTPFRCCDVVEPTINQPRLQIGYILAAFFLLDATLMGFRAAISSFRPNISERRLQIGYISSKKRRKRRRRIRERENNNQGKGARLLLG